MKKNLIKSFALACGLLASVGVYAQNSAATTDGRQVGDKFVSKGVQYEVTNVTNTTDLTGNAECKILGVADGATAITVATKSIVPEGATADVFVLTGGLDNQFATAEDLEEVEAVDETPVTVPADAFAAVVYQDAILTIPAGDFQAYRVATGWKNFLNVIDTDDVILGDLNEDGVVDFEDVSLMRAYAKDGIEDGDDEFSFAFDMTGDGFLDFEDVTLLKQSAVHTAF